MILLFVHVQLLNWLCIILHIKSHAFQDIMQSDFQLHQKYIHVLLTKQSN